MDLNTGVLGWYGKKNIGDESYKLSFPRLFNRHKLSFHDQLSGDFDHVILGGGDTISPKTIENILSYDCPKHLLSVSVSDLKDLGYLNQFDTVAVRSIQTREELASRGFFNIDYCPDFAFVLEASRSRGEKIWKKIFKESNRELYENKVVVVINSHLLAKNGESLIKSALFDKMIIEISSLCDNFNASFLFLPFGTGMPWDDRVTGSLVQSKCKFWQKNVEVYDAYSVQETLDIMAAADATISTRLHSSIFSIIGGTPFIDIVHNHKNKELLETVGLESYGVDYHAFSKDTLNDRLNYLFLNKADTITEIESVRDKQREVLFDFQKNKIFSI